MKLILSLFLPLLFFSPELEENSTPAEDWKLAKNKNGIVVYTRQAAGSKIKEFQTIVKIKTDIQSVIKMIENVEKYPEWQDNISNAKTLKKISSTERYMYYSLEVPWPIQDRDAVVFCKKTIYKSGEILFRLNSKPDYIKEIENYIRIRDAKGFWKLVPMSGGIVKVVYQSYGDPEGSIPSGIINMFIVDGPYKTMLNLRNKLEAS